jgi:hypothetical protein
VREQRVLVLEQSVMAGVQFMRLGQAKIGLGLQDDIDLYDAEQAVPADAVQSLAAN